MYALFGYIEYEGSSFLGVYSSEETARLAHAQFVDGDFAYNFHGYYLEQIKVDAPADWDHESYIPLE